MVDIEFYGDYIEHPKSAEEVRPILDALLARLEAHYGQKPILYVTNESYRLYVAGRYGGYPLWCSFPILSPFWREWTFWQYSHHAVLDGYEGAERYIDLNVFRGGPDELRAMTRPAPPEIRQRRAALCGRRPPGKYDTGDLPACTVHRQRGLSPAPGGG